MVTDEEVLEWAKEKYPKFVGNLELVKKLYEKQVGPITEQDSKRERVDEEYDLKKSEGAVGQLQPVILDVQGRVVDGKHRLEVNPNWKVEKHDEIKTDRDLWLTRLHLNDARRNAHEARKEKIEGIAGLAEYYEKQGLTVFGSKTVHGGGHQNEILDAVIKDLAGAISENFIRVNIPDKYVQGQRESASVKQATLSKKRPKSRGVETQDFVPSGRVLEDSSRLLSVMNAWSYDQFADLKDADWTVLKVILSQIEERIKWVRDGGWKEETAVDFDSMASETEEKKAKADGAEEIAG